MHGLPRPDQPRPGATRTVTTGWVRLLTAALALPLALAVSMPAHAGPATRSQDQVVPVAAPAPRSAAVLRYEAQVLVRSNMRRARSGCRPLVRNTALTKAARRHSARMAEHLTLSHQLPGERVLARRVEAAGYRRWTRIAENVAFGYPTAARVVAAWMSSPGHRANILDCRLRHLGVGVTVRNGTVWVTQDFGRR